MLSKAFLESEAHRRLGERFLQQFAGCDRRRAESDRSTRSRKISHLERSPGTPADEAGLAEFERIHRRADGASSSGSE